MNWYKEIKDRAGQHMSVTRIEGVSYEQLKEVFGPPHKEETFRNGKIHTVEWILEILGIKYTLRIDSNDATREYFREKGIDKYTVPAVDDEIVKEAELIGDRTFATTVIGPLIKMMATKYNSKTSRNTIKFVFEDYKGDLYP